jgi:hypothetical protein
MMNDEYFDYLLNFFEEGCWIPAKANVSGTETLQRTDQSGTQDTIGRGRYGDTK